MNRRRPPHRLAASRSLILAAVIAGGTTFSASSPAYAQPKRPPLGDAQTYKTVGKSALRLYLLKPDDWNASDRRPCLVFFHGGGWSGGTPGQFNEHAKYFASRGVVCALVEYRLLKGQPPETPMDVCIQDARSAMRWLRTHADELGIDPDRIAAAGGSAGGHLAAHLGLVDVPLDDPQDDLAVSFKPQALVLFNPAYDLGPDSPLGERVGERYPELSPMHNISPGDPPTIVFLGTEDRLIPVATAETFDRRMKDAGNRSELVLFEGVPHGFFNYGLNENKPYVKTIIATDRFLASLGWLSGEPTIQDVD